MTVRHLKHLSWEAYSTEEQMDGLMAICSAYWDRTRKSPLEMLTEC